ALLRHPGRGPRQRKRRIEPLAGVIVKPRVERTRVTRGGEGRVRDALCETPLLRVRFSRILDSVQVGVRRSADATRNRADTTSRRRTGMRFTLALAVVLLPLTPVAAEGIPLGNGTVKFVPTEDPRDVPERYRLAGRTFTYE